MYAHPLLRRSFVPGAMTDDNEEEVARMLARGKPVICLPFVAQLFPDHRASKQSNAIIRSA